MTLPTAGGDNIVVHAPSEVAYLKGAKDYTEVILASGSQYLVSGNIEKKSGHGAWRSVVSCVCIGHIA
jgi:DNA-binding LytR/AlgR family response regulator